MIHFGAPISIWRRMFKFGDFIVLIEWCLFQFEGAYFNFGALVSIEERLIQFGGACFN